MFAILVTCWIEAGSRECTEYALEEPYRTLSECLIAIEAADRGLRRIPQPQLESGTCTLHPPAKEPRL